MTENSSSTVAAHRNQATPDADHTSAAKPPEFDLNLRPGVHMMSPPRFARSPPGLPSPGSSMVGSPNRNNLDELSDCFSSSFTVTNTPNDTNRPHPRFAQFKQKSNVSNQEERRKRLLTHQKEKREELIHYARAIAMGEFEDEGEEEEEEDMDTSGELKQRRLRKTYKNQLMLSEWLVEVPEDLATNWILILCPEGRRNFVVASNGSTKVYSKSGKQVKSFPSNLPGGNRIQGGRSRKYTILDCIFSESKGVFYILDMMCWDGFQYYDCDTEFRLTWVQQKFIENKDLMVKSRINPYSFQPLPVYECTTDSISAALNSAMPFDDRLDGILIYHKQVHYMPGKTPLVGWLKGFMVPELMDIQVAEDLLSQRPSDYGGMKVYLKKTYERVERMKKDDDERRESEMEAN